MVPGHKGELLPAPGLQVHATLLASIHGARMLSSAFHTDRVSGRVFFLDLGMYTRETVPLIHDDKVIAYGAQGMLWCQGLAKGETIWSHDTHADYQAPAGYFGAGSSPIVVDDKVIVNVGGARSGAGHGARTLRCRPRRRRDRPHPHPKVGGHLGCPSQVAGPAEAGHS